MFPNKLRCLLLLVVGHWLLTNFGRADEPLPQYKRVLANEDAKRVADLRNEITAQLAVGNSAQAEKAAEDLLQIRMTAQGNDHWETVNARFSLEAMKVAHKELVPDLEAYKELTKLQQEAQALLPKQQFVQAQALLEKALEISRKLWGELHPGTARSYTDVAYCFNAQAKYPAAQPFYEKALLSYRKGLGESHPHTAQSYANVGSNLSSQSKYTEAHPHFEKALAICLQVLGESHPQTAKSYSDLAGNLKALGKYTDAKQFYEKALSICIEVFGETHTSTTNCYDDLGTNLNAQAKFAEAQPWLEKALALRRQASGEMNQFTAASYNNVANNLNMQGKYAEAQPQFEKALAIHREVLGEFDQATATSYKNLAGNLNVQGKYAEAQPLYEKALAIFRQTLGESHLYTGVGYNGVAVNLNAQAKYAEAQPLYEKALLIFRQVLGENHAYVGLAYNNLAANLQGQGRPAEAQPLFEQALAIFGRVLGKTHSQLALTYNNAANNLDMQGKFVEGQVLRDKALAICLELFGETHADTAQSLHGIASNLNAQRKYTEAQPVYEKTLEIRRKVLGEFHPFTALSYYSLASNLESLGKLGDAQPFNERALAINRRVLGETHPQTSFSYLNLAANLQAQGKISEAIPYWQAACQAWDTARLHVAGKGFERAQFRANYLSPHAGLAVALSALQEPEQAWFHLEAHLSRGLLDDLDPESGQSNAMPARLAKLDDQLIPLLVRSDLSPEQSKLREALSEERAALLKTLADAAAARAAKRVWTLEKIQATLDADTAIVCWLDVRGEHFACIVSHSGPPIWRRLAGTGPSGGWTGDDENLTQSTYTALAVPSDPTRDNRLAALRVQRLDPLLPRLQGIRRLLVVPTGDMAKIPIEALTDQFTVSYIPSASIYAQLHQRHRPLEGRSLLALGDPIFTDPAQQPSSTPSATDQQLAQRSNSYPGLPGTKVEVEALARLVSNSKLLLGSAASEQSLEDMAEAQQLKEYRLLHLATHAEVNEAIPTQSALILSQAGVSQTLDDQLTRTLSHKKPMDGRLTVGTILDKWKLDADQVVLSACETGLGAKAGGEGILGFAQALLQSGARSVVLSRWKVPDAATSLLMQRYYLENILGKREGLESAMPRAEGLREAKHWLSNLTQSQIDQQLLTLPYGEELLRSVKKAVSTTEQPAPRAASDRPFAAPYYWAAFVLIGEPE